MRGERSGRHVEDNDIASGLRYLLDGIDTLLLYGLQKLHLLLLHVAACHLLELLITGLEVVELLLLKLTHGVTERIGTLLELLQFGVELHAYGLKLRVEILGIGLYLRLRLLELVHAGYDLLRVDAAELLCEERCRDHRTYNHKG